VGHRAEDALELLRNQSGLSIARDGTFLHRGEPITHARTREVLWRSLERVPDGRYLVRIGREWASVDIEDAPYVVRGVLAGEDGLTLVLSDGTQEALDPATLSADAQGALHCQVKGGHRAGFTSAAQVTLGLALEEDPDGSGRYLLTLRGTRWPVRRE
jgi:hypothetical protein